MRKTVTAGFVKKMKPGTDVYVVRECNGQTGKMTVVKSGRKKLLKGLMTKHDIRDRAGWHYEVDVNG